jgi:hypothetical protein
MIDLDQADVGANITIQRKVGNEKINIPAKVIGVTDEFTRVKYKNGVEDIITKESPYSLFNNQKEEVEEKEFLSKENQNNKSYVQTELKNGKNVYTKTNKSRKC